MMGPIQQTATVMICLPREGEMICDDVVAVEGYAASSLELPVERVEVSTDSGKTWQDARLMGMSDDWARRYWEAHLRLRPGTHQIIARAWRGEPHESHAWWHPAGDAKASWHRIKIKVEEFD